MRRARLLPLFLLAVAVAAVWTASPAPAATRFFAEQGAPGKPFTFEALPPTLEKVATQTDGEDLLLSDTVLGRIDRTSTVYGGAYPDPRSVEVLDNGHFLFTDRNASMVAETTAVGEPVWMYTKDQDPALANPFSAQRFERDGRSYTLVADRVARRVWVVDADFATVWQYGVTGDTTSGNAALAVNHLADPFYARYSPEDGGTVLIADNLRGFRVIEVRYADYRPGEVDNGFSAASITWSYGKPGVPGNGPGELAKPHCARLLADGDVLICDAGDDVYGARVIQVDRGGSIVWQYGVTGPPGAGNGYLTEANFASRLADGDTLITDTAAGRVIRVTQNKVIEHIWDQNTIARPPGYGSGNAAPRAAALAADGRLVVADSVFCQLVTLGHESSAAAASLPLDCGRPGLDKAFVSITWKGDTGVAGTRIALEYRLNGGAWHPCRFAGGSRRYDFPAGSHGTTIAYRVTLSTTNRAQTPTLDSVFIQAIKASAGGSGGGGGGDKPGGSGNSGQSGVYSYPSIAEGGTGSSGTGTGSGGYGSGTGSGSSGAGSGSSGAGAGSTSVANSVEVPVQSTGSGDTQAVQGYQVQGEAGVSGVPLRAMEGPQAPEPERPGPAVPVAALVAAGLIVAAAFFVPWPFVAAHLRRITGFDHTRPARILPFRPLGK